MSDSSSSCSEKSSMPPSPPPRETPSLYAVGTFHIAKHHIPPLPSSRLYPGFHNSDDEADSDEELGWQPDETDQDTLKATTQREWCLSHSPCPGTTDPFRTRSFTITKAIRTGDQSGAQVVLTDDGLVAKIYDPLYYNFYDVDLYDMRLDIVAEADEDFFRETAAYRFLSGTPFAGTATPKYHGSWTLDVCIDVNGSEVVREVRMILIEYIDGVCMCDIHPIDDITNAARENIMAKLIEINTDLEDFGLKNNDLEPRNIMISAPDNDFTQEDLRICIIDLAMTVIPLKKGHNSSGKPKPRNPIVYWWSCTIWSSYGWMPLDYDDTCDWIWEKWGDGGRDGKYAKMVRSEDNPKLKPDFLMNEVAAAKEDGAGGQGVKRTADGEEKATPCESAGASSVNSHQKCNTAGGKSPASTQSTNDEASASIPNDIPGISGQPSSEPIGIEHIGKAPTCASCKPDVLASTTLEAVNMEYPDEALGNEKWAARETPLRYYAGS
ncbi:hypothetical protein CC80DRAFT_495965 [Byssothecium circinans]|uniref:Protein kinase domain-containing protein n=1 Tax=Byssothecium circinans TaxID=147558 RepID=A0A6A5TG51_9PLEO|nr:hypothetical protein CC80DRAFT_495965 [Byssothecium circinans]